MSASLTTKWVFSLVAVFLSWLFFISLCTGAMLMAGYIRPSRAGIGWGMTVWYYGYIVAFSSIFICWCLSGGRIHLARLVVPLFVIAAPLFLPLGGAALHEVFPYRCWLLLGCGILTNALIAATWILVVHFSNRSSRRSRTD